MSKSEIRLIRLKGSAAIPCMGRPPRSSLARAPAVPLRGIASCSSTLPPSRRSCRSCLSCAPPRGDARSESMMGLAVPVAFAANRDDEERGARRRSLGSDEPHILSVPHRLG
jgi:hypothetical protein